MHDLLFSPANEWHDYRGCRLLRARAVFAARRGFVFVDNPCVQEVGLIDTDDHEPAASSSMPPESAQEEEEDHPPTPPSSPPPADPMIAGYIVLSKRTTLAVFRGILPGSTRFFFLPAPLLRALRGERRPAPEWCKRALSETHRLLPPPAAASPSSGTACRQLVAADGVNKPPPDCAQHMSGYYTGLACLVLFDARGPAAGASCGGGWEYLYIYLTLGASALLLSLKYLPTILHRPQQLVDALCSDVLCIAAHATFIAMAVDPCLKHGCALHSACFILQQRFMGRMPPAATVLGRGGGESLVHTVLVLTLLGAYAYGPRISDVRQFMLSAVCPHALELLAQLLAHLHRLAVISWCSAVDS